VKHLEHERKRNRDYQRKKNGVVVTAADEELYNNALSCEICGITFTGKRSEKQLDHDHKTGRVRGVICYKCNSVLGYAKDDSRILILAANYLINRSEIQKVIAG
jgi:hypothetical protein